MSFKERISNTSSGPILITMESEVALVIASIANAVLRRHKLFSVATVVAVGVYDASFIDFFASEQTAAMFADCVVGGGPAFVVVLGAVFLEDGAKVHADDDPVDGRSASQNQFNILLSPASKANTEVPNLSERKNLHILVYGVKDFVCLSVCN